MTDTFVTVSLLQVEQMFNQALTDNTRLVWFIPLIAVLFLVETVFKVIALWKAGNHKQLARFLCLIIFNTCGILPAIYLIWFQKQDK
jgi:hypothetical protein